MAWGKQCAFCGFMSRGYGYDRRVLGHPGESKSFCSLDCLNVYIIALEKNMSLSIQEINAMEYSLKAVAEYVAKTEKGRMVSDWSKEEVLGLIRTTVEEFKDKFRDMVMRDAPF